MALEMICLSVSVVAAGVGASLQKILSTLAARSMCDAVRLYDACGPGKLSGMEC